MMRYEFLQHMTSGDIFAVQMDDQEDVISSVGPIAVADLSYDPSDFVTNMSDEDNEWFAEQDEQAGDTGAFRLFEGTELTQAIGWAHEGKS